MKKLITFVLLLTVFTQCKKREDPEPLPEIASIVGKWRVTAYSHIAGDSLVTTPASDGQATIYQFRFDGAFLDENGYMPCCLPQKFTLNGQPFEQKPLAPVKLDPICSSVYCITCPEMKITTPIADVIMIETCKGNFMTLAREN